MMCLILLLKRTRMLKDINFDKVVEVAVAIIKNEVEGNVTWDTYIINYNEVEIDTVLITSRGFGEIDGEQRKTSTMRKVIEAMPPKSFAKIEPIDPDLFCLFHEFWVSFRKEGQMLDKKFLFAPDSVIEENLITIPLLGANGVMIK